MKKVIFSLAIILTAGLVSCAQVDKKVKTSSKQKIQSETLINSDKEKSPSKPILLTKKDFLEKVMDYKKNPNEWKFEGDKPAMIDFYADWCAPCKKAAPVLDKLAKEYAGKIDFYKVDTEKEKELAGVFGIRSIPAFLWIPKDGKPQMTNGIAQTAEDTEKMFKQIIVQLLLKEDDK